MITENRIPILRLNACLTTSQLAAVQICEWAKAGESRYVCVANVHMVMEAYDHTTFADVVNAADLTVSDGKPLALFMSLCQRRKQCQIRGPALTMKLLEVASKQVLKVGFYGASPETLENLVNNLQQMFPRLDIAFAYSPPFRAPTAEENGQVAEKVNNAGVQILFVGLGCPKQEIWMASQKGKVHAVMIGVGQAFDIHAGTLAEAPGWMQTLGMEWFFRFICEPRRLWKRYLKNNPRFVVLAMRQLLRGKILRECVAQRQKL